jgi:hypothetical protein
MKRRSLVTITELTRRATDELQEQINPPLKKKASAA